MKTSGQIISRIRFKDGEGEPVGPDGLPPAFSQDTSDSELSKLFNKGGSNTPPEPKPDPKVETPAEPIQKTPSNNAPKASGTPEPVKVESILGLSLPKVSGAKPGATPTPKAPGVPELEAIQPPKGASPNTLEGFKTLKETTSKIVSAERSKNADLQKQLNEALTKGNGELEALKKENEQLKGYRALIDIQADPEFISKFQKPIDAQKAGIAQVLKAFGANDEEIKAADLENPNVVEAIAGMLDEKGTPQAKTSANVIRTKGARIAELRADANSELEGVKGKHAEYMAERSRKSQASQAEMKMGIASTVESLGAMKGPDGQPTYPILTIMSIPETATPEEIQQIEAHNAHADGIRKMAVHYAEKETPHERAAIGTAAAMLKVYVQACDVLTKQTEALRAELSKISATTVQPKTRINGALNGTKPNAASSVELTSDDALETAFPGRF